MLSLTGKTMVVIGGSRGVGQRIVETGVRNGAHVLAVARQEAPLRQLAREVPGVEVLSLDATDEGAASKVFDVLPPDILVLCAGAFPPAAPIHEQTWREFAVNWETDVKIAFHFCKAALSLPLPAGASVVLISSGAAVAGSPISGGYAGAKRTQMFIKLQSEGIGSARTRLAVHGARAANHAGHRHRETRGRGLFPLSRHIRGRLHQEHGFTADLIRCRDRGHRAGNQSGSIQGKSVHGLREGPRSRALTMKSLEKGAGDVTWLQ